LKNFLISETSRTDRQPTDSNRELGGYNDHNDLLYTPIPQVKNNNLISNSAVLSVLRTPTNLSIKDPANSYYLPIFPAVDSNSTSYGQVLNSSTKMSSMTSIKRVKSLYKTELRLRESINKGISEKNSIILSSDSKKKIPKISNFHTNTLNDEGKLAKTIVKEMYFEISDRKKFAQISKFSYAPPYFSESSAFLSTKDSETPKGKKNMPTLAKSNFFEINSNVSFPSIVKDKNIICSVYNENIINLKKFFNARYPENFSTKNVNTNFSKKIIWSKNSLV
jgi:hypothetical protein